MGLYKKKVLKVSKGQITPKLIERTDIGILDSSGQTIDGFINSKYGNLSTIPGTKLGYVFGADKAVRLFIVNLLDGTDAVLAINATDDYLLLLDKTGTAISTQISALGKFSADTLSQVSIAQNNDLILIASPGNPLYQFIISDNNVLQFKLFNIDLENVIKVKTLTNTESNPIVFRDTETAIDATDLEYFQDNGIGIGDYIQLSQTTATPPSNTFPWNVKQIKSLPNPDTFSITDIDVNSIPYPNTYATGDVLSVNAVPNNVACTITGVNLTTGLPASRTSGTTEIIQSIADDGNGTIIAITTDLSSPYTPYILKSTNKGTTWTATQITTTGPTWTIKYVNGYFVILGSVGAVPTGGLILTSTDGTSWISRTSGVSITLRDITYMGGKYVIVGDSGTILSSTDLSTWTAQTIAPTYLGLSHIANDGTTLVAISGGGKIFTSSDAIIWTERTSGISAAFANIRYLNNQFIIVGDRGILLTSPTGTTWTSHNTGTSVFLYDILFNPITPTYGTYEIMVNASYVLVTNTNFSNFTQLSISASYLRACITSDDVNIFVGSAGSIYTQSLTLDAQITLNSPLASYTDDPAGTDLATTGGSGTGLTVDITSSITAATYQDATFTAVKDNICRNIWDNSNWIYNNSWLDQSTSYQSNQTYTAAWRVNAVSGYVTLSIQSAAYITITKPSTYTGTPKQFAEKLLIGLQLDGNAALGIMTIDAITGSASGNDYRITAISGMTYINFISTAVTTNQTDFTIMFSQISAFDVDYADSQNNLFATDNFPKTIFFYQQRLVIAGTKLDTAQLIWSQTALYNDFSDDLSGAATNAFQLRISGTEYESIQNVVLNQGIQIFTDKSEWLMNDSIITKNSGFIQNSKVGSSVVKPVIGANGITLFVQKNGLGLLGFIYNNTNASFNTPYISLFTDIIDAEIIDMCLKKGYSSNDDVLVYLTLSNGKLAIANYMNDQQIQAFVGQSSSSYLQAVQADSTIMLLTEVNGSVCVEITDSDKYTWGSYDNFVYDFSTGIVSGLPNQYNGLSVNVYDQNHDFIGEYAVASNTFTITGGVLPTSLTEIGFNIHSIFVSNPIDINSNTFSLYKTIKNIRLVVNESNKTDYLKINDKNGRNYNGFVSYPRPARPLRKQQFTIENDVYPVEIYSMEIEVEA